MTEPGGLSTSQLVESNAELKNNAGNNAGKTTLATGERATLENGQ